MVQSIPAEHQHHDSNLKQFDLTEIQQRLSKMPLYSAAIDGLYGPDTRRSIQAALIREGAKDWRGWPEARLITAAQQMLCNLNGIDAGVVDGLTGPQTRYATQAYTARLNGDTQAELWRDKEEAKPEIQAASVAATRWPQQKDCTRFFGAPGKNQTRLKFPYPMRIAWDLDTTVQSTLCHEKIHDAAARVFARVLDHYGPEAINHLGLDLFGGCLNIRKMRGGSAWSMHSWGIAFDFDPARNRLRWGKDRAEFAMPAYSKWFDLWEEEGALSLGRARNYDWMHVQFARL